MVSIIPQTLHCELYNGLILLLRHCELYNGLNYTSDILYNGLILLLRHCELRNGLTSLSDIILKARPYGTNLISSLSTFYSCASVTTQNTNSSSHSAETLLEVHITKTLSTASTSLSLTQTTIHPSTRSLCMRDHLSATSAAYSRPVHSSSEQLHLEYTVIVCIDAEKFRLSLSAGGF
ncbi:hypothetical protein Tco_1171862 [Tanacetum coccineum]